MRALVWMADARREFEGEALAWLAKQVPVAVWAPALLLGAGDINPFRLAEPESEAMRRHRESWAKRRFRVLSGG